MIGTFKLIGVVAICATLYLGLDRVATWLDGYGIHIPHSLSALKQTTVTSDKTKVEATFASMQGIAAGETPIEGLNAKADTRFLGIPKEVIGSCTKITNAHAKATYISRIDKHPMVVDSTPLGTVLHLPDPEPTQVGLVDFNDPKNSMGCGVLWSTNGSKNVQKLNDKLQQAACEKTGDDAATINDRRHDAEETAKKLVTVAGVNPATLKFEWFPVQRDTPSECKEDK